ncbi:MAG: PilW family protein [Gammaproteobacteria bacterium]|jgi:type IV pilus assembly protein PilW|nr:pilus assembly protein PilW [Gammaproteobacteria bacterium]MDP6095418.1 PilW family protein [Gammaproteobacteria bacterium]HJO12117.1 PilW family protein [Gammaproteobacteria bacterium]|tara:strand:- start:3787 stop:4926 length:1140 start_codon:yes stop_codon:yes gene_type:complete
MKKYYQNSKASHGLSLIELLIAMALGLTITAGVIQIYVGNNATERSQEARGRIQENGRFALNFLSQELRMAGYLGCLSGINAASVNNILNAPPASFQPQIGLQGWEAAGTNPDTISNSVNNVAVVATGAGGWGTTGGNVLPAFNAIPGSDIIRAWSSFGTAAIINTVTAGVTPVINSRPINIAANDFLLLSDCDQADLVQACAVANVGPGISTNITLSTACVPGNVASSAITSQAGGEVVKLEGTLLYVGKRGDVATNPPALFVRRLGANGIPGVAEELIEGVESMQALYGVNMDNDVRNTVDSYLPADQVPDWTNVISIRITLLMQSIESGVVPAAQAYTFNGVTYDGGGGNGALPGDTRVRRVFSSTINLRNRALGI